MVFKKSKNIKAEQKRFVLKGFAEIEVYGKGKRYRKGIKYLEEFIPKDVNYNFLNRKSWYKIRVFIDTKIPIKETDFSFFYNDLYLFIKRRVGRTFHIYSNISPDVVVEKLLFFLFLKNDIAPIHASGIEKDGTCYFFSARGGVGKTSTVFSILQYDISNKFLGDDRILIRKDGRVFPFPKRLNIYSYHLELFGLDPKTVNRSTFSLFIRNILYSLFNFFISCLKNIFKTSYEIPSFPIKHIGSFDIHEILPKVRISSGGRYGLGFFLEKSNTFNIEKICKKEFIQNIVTSTMEEETWGHTSLFYAISNFFKILPEYKLYEILNSAIRKESCFKLYLQPLTQKNVWQKWIQSFDKTINKLIGNVELGR